MSAKERPLARLPQEERLLFCMGLNAFLTTVLMDATMTVRDAELSCDDGESSDRDDKEEDENLMMMQKQWSMKRPRESQHEPQQFHLLLQTFSAALQRLLQRGRATAARTMKRWLAQACGGQLGENGQALEALLVVHGEDEQDTGTGGVRKTGGGLASHVVGALESSHGADGNRPHGSGQLVESRCADACNTKHHCGFL